MPFDLGFNFRETAGFVTDPSYAVPVLVENYPHTYTNADGKSINAGWGPAGPHGGANGLNRSAANDPRIAGINYVNCFAFDTNPNTFTVDLGSGSAPGAGVYLVDIASGDQAAGRTGSNFVLYDNTTPLISSGKFSPAADHYLDATLTDVAGGAVWNGSQASKPFATTTVNLTVNEIVAGLGEDYTMIAHLRLTLVPSAAHTPRRLLTLGVGA